MVHSLSLTIVRHCQSTEYTSKTASANGGRKINIYLVRREQRLENVDKKYVECLQTKMRAHYQRCKRQYKSPIKQDTAHGHHIHQ